MLRKAKVGDIPAIQTLIHENLDKLLPRETREIEDLIAFFYVVEEDDGQVVGCCCLEVYSPKIAEIRSVAVRSDRRERGYGSDLVHAAVADARQQNIREIMVVTSSLPFFQQLGFSQCLNEKYALFWTGETPAK